MAHTQIHRTAREDVRSERMRGDSLQWNMMDMPAFSKQVSSFVPLSRIREKLPSESITDPAKALSDANQSAATSATAITPNESNPYSHALRERGALFFATPKGELGRSDEEAAVVFRAPSADELARGGSNAAITLESPEQFLPRYGTPPNADTSFFSPDFSEDADGESDDAGESVKALVGDAVDALHSAHRASMSKPYLLQVPPRSWHSAQTVSALLRGDIVESHLTAKPMIGAVSTFFSLGRAYRSRLEGLDITDDDFPDGSTAGGDVHAGDGLRFACPRGYVTGDGVYIPSAIGYLSGGFLKKLAKKVKKVVKKVATVVKKVANNPVFKAVASVGKAVLSATPVGAAINAASTVAKTVAGAVKGVKAVSTAVNAAKAVKNAVSAISPVNTSSSTSESAVASEAGDSTQSASSSAATTPTIETASTSSSSTAGSTSTSAGSVDATSAVTSALAAIRSAASSATGLSKLLGGDATQTSSAEILANAARLALASLVAPAVETASKYDPNIEAALSSSVIPETTARSIAQYAPTPNALTRIAKLRGDVTPTQLVASAVGAALTGYLPPASRSALYSQVSALDSKWPNIDPSKITPSAEQLAHLAAALLGSSDTWSDVAESARQSVVEGGERAIRSNYDLGIIAQAMAESALASVTSTVAVPSQIASDTSVDSASAATSQSDSSAAADALSGDLPNPYRPMASTETSQANSADSGSKSTSGAANSDGDQSRSSTLYPGGVGESSTVVSGADLMDPAMSTAMAVIRRRFGDPPSPVVAALMAPPKGSAYAEGAGSNSTWTALQHRGGSSLLTLLWHSAPIGKTDGAWLVKLPTVSPDGSNRSGATLGYKYYALPSGSPFPADSVYVVQPLVDPANPLSLISYLPMGPSGISSGVIKGASILRVALTPSNVQKVTSVAKAAYALYKLLMRFVKVARSKGVDAAMTDLPAAAAAIKRIADARGMTPPALGKFLTMAGGAGVVAAIRWITASFGSNRISHIWDWLLEQFGSDPTVGESQDAANGDGPDISDDPIGDSDASKQGSWETFDPFAGDPFDLSPLDAPDCQVVPDIGNPSTLGADAAASPELLTPSDAKAGSGNIGYRAAPDWEVFIP